MLFSHLRQRYAVYPLGAEHVDVVEFGQLLRRERFRRPEHHMPGIVHENIEPALFGDNLADRRFDGPFRRHVQFNRTQVNLIVVRKLFHVRSLRRVATGSIPHRGVDSVAGLREGIGGQTAKATRSSGDYDYLLHDWLLLYLVSRVSLQRSELPSVGEATVSTQYLRVHPSTIWTCQKGNDAGDIFRLSQAFQRWQLAQFRDLFFALAL